MALFTTSNYPLMALIEDIDLGKIGLPELQRPFVWPNVNVRDLFDSLYRGYPAGFLLFWETGVDAELKGIGVKNHQAAPKLAIVDGQQRLTSLYAVVKGAEILRANFKKERIQIAFNPLSGRFDVADAAIRKDKAFIPDISILRQPDFKPSAYRKGFLQQLREIRELSEDEAERIEDSIDHPRNLLHYSFVALTLSSSVDDETIAEVFVRINGKGKALNQADFIMTLMSVFWDEGRAELEAFARAATRPSDGQASPFNRFIKPSPDQLLRATVGLSLKRARLENVYGALRGRNAKTGLDDPERRNAQFALMRDGQKAALNLTNWHHFMDALKLAGYRGEKMISSEAAIIFSYVLYLIGLRDYAVDRATMRQAIAEFFFMAALTGRYTNSPETRFESDLSLVRDQPDGAAFLARLRELCATTLTGDYWAITLPSQLATSASRSPSLFAYQAALIKLDANVLYSPFKIAAMIDPAVKGTKAALEQHHLFPRGYLEETGTDDLKQINQIANFAAVEWPANLKIGKRPPADYVPPLDHKMTGEERDRMYGWHALPPLWWELPYHEFLVQRRVRMADVIRQAWKLLTIGSAPAAAAAPVAIADLIAGGESGAVEFKSTLRTNLHTGQVDDKIQLAALKTIAGFLNAKGGTLLIGVADGGEVLGLMADGFTNEDKLGLHLVNLIKDRVGEVFLPYVHPHFEDQNGARVLAIRCEKGPKAAFVKDGSLQRFFVRGGNATTELSGSSVTDYAKQRFG
ncbi:MAG: GmrSD restriction endonuclease domain-containing protein [Gemmataceae bacterium]